MRPSRLLITVLFSEIKMEKRISKNGGFAMVYGLAVLFLTTVTGMSILILNNRDSATAFDYAKMRESQVAARTALSAFEGQCDKQPQDILDILKRYNRDKSKKWLLGKVADAGTENRIKLWDGSESSSFSACILKFDSTSMLIQVQGIGYGGHGGRKKVTAIYKLAGIALTKDNKRKDAIFLLGTGRNFDQRINVTGDIYCAADVHFNSGATGSVINGDFRTGNSDLLSSFDGTLTINGTAYFQTPLRTQWTGVLTVNGKSGFEKKLDIDAKVQLYGDTYINDVVNGHEFLYLNKNVLTHSGKVSFFRIAFGSASEIINNNGKIDIADKLDLAQVVKPVYSVDIDTIPSDKIYNYSSLCGSNGNWNNFTAFELNQKYIEAANIGKLWNGFLVIRINCDAAMRENKFVTFNGKVIWIVERTLNCNSNWYKCSPASNTLMFVKAGGKVSDFGSTEYFRGYVHVEGTGKVIYGWKNGSYFKGAIHHVSPSAGFQMNSGGVLNIEYDVSVLDDFLNAGVVNSTSSVNSEMVLNDVKVRTEMLGANY